jgi:hypothetical protein
MRRAPPRGSQLPGASLAERFVQMRKTLASEDDPVDFQALQHNTVREIEREYRDSARRERQRLKRLRNKERKGNGTRTGGAAGALSG